MLVQIGSRGSDVASVQTALRNLGWSNVNIDGVFGPITQQAVIDFQYLSGIPTTGVVDDGTYGAMQEVIGQQIVNAGGVPYNAILPAALYNPIVTPTTTTTPTGTTIPGSPASTPTDSMTVIGMVMLGVTLLLVARKTHAI